MEKQYCDTSSLFNKNISEFNENIPEFAEKDLDELEKQYCDTSSLFNKNISEFNENIPDLLEHKQRDPNETIYQLRHSWNCLSENFLSYVRKDVFWKKAYFGCIVLFIPALVAPFTIPLYGSIGFILALTSFTLFVIKKQNNMSRKIELEVERVAFLFRFNKEVNKMNVIECVFKVSNDIRNIQNSGDNNNLQSAPLSTQYVSFKNINPQINYMLAQIGEQQEVTTNNHNHEITFNMHPLDMNNEEDKKDAMHTQASPKNNFY